MKVAIIGGGYIGTVIAGVLSRKDIEVTVVEKNQTRLNKLKSGESPINEPGLDLLIKAGHNNNKIRAVEEINDFKDPDVIIVTVGTPMNLVGEVDISDLEEVFLEISNQVKKKTLIILKSTVEPGTTLYLFNKFLNDSIHYLSFSPERLSEGTAIHEFENLPIIVGGVNKNSTTKTIKFWSDLNFKTIEVSSCTVAEMVKLSDNAWIDLNIAFAHEIAKVCDKLEIDVLEVIGAANTLKKGSSNVNILVPSIGVGGYCLTKDPIFLSNFAKSFGIDLGLTNLARKINDGSPEYLLNKLLPKINIKYSKILIEGIAYKNNTGDIRFSPVITLFNLLYKKGYSINWHDTFAEECTDPALNSAKLTSIIYDNIWDVIVVGAVHDKNEYVNVYNIQKLLRPGGIIVDGRKFYTQKEINIFFAAGFEYIGVGR